MFGALSLAETVRHRFQEAQQQTALDRVIHILRQRPARRQRRPRIQLGRHDADHVAPLIHQRPARIARLHRHADLKIPRVIPRAGQRRDFPLGQLGREPLQTDVGKTDRRHRAAQLRRPAGCNGQRRKLPVRFEQRQIIGRIHLNHLGVNQTRAREQTNLRRILDHMIIGNQITIVRDEKARAAGCWTGFRTSSMRGLNSREQLLCFGSLVWRHFFFDGR